MDFGSSEEQQERIKSLLVSEIYQRAQLSSHRISLPKMLKYLKQLVRYSGRILLYSPY